MTQVMTDGNTAVAENVDAPLADSHNHTNGTAASNGRPVNPSPNQKPQSRAEAAKQQHGDATLALTTLARGNRAEMREIRALDVPAKYGKPCVGSTYYKDIPTGANLALTLNNTGPSGVYVTVNPVDPECYARSPNKITYHPKNTTVDRDTIRRRWLPLDIDPERPAGVPATQAKAEAAVAYGYKLAALLRERYGWAEPVIWFSGNGVYLLFAIDLPNDEESLALVNAALQAIAHLADSENLSGDGPRCHVDTTVGNASRILRVPGTHNAKGDKTPDQPHRLSGVLSTPDPVVEVTLEQLRAVAALAPQQQRGKVTSNNRTRPAGSSNTQSTAKTGTGDYRHRLLVDNYLRDRGVTVHNTKAAANGWNMWLITCPFDEGHGQHTDTAVFQGPNGEMGARCKHDSCQGWHWQELKAKIGPPDPEHYDPPLQPKKHGQAGQNANRQTGGSGGSSSRR